MHFSIKQNDLAYDSKFVDLLSTFVDSQSTPAIDEMSPSSTTNDFSSTESATAESTTIVDDESTDMLPTISPETFSDFPRLKSFVINSENGHMVFKSNATTISYNDESTEGSDSNDGFIVPLKIILPIRHAHANASSNSSYEQFNYVVLKSNDSAFHEHLSDDKPLHLFPARNKSVEHATPTTDNSIIADKSNGTSTTVNSGATTNGNEIDRHDDKVIDIWADNDGFRYKKLKQHRIYNEAGDQVVEFDEFVYDSQEEVTVPSNRLVEDGRDLSDDEGNLDDSNAEDMYDYHYAKIMAWLHYQL